MEATIMPATPGIKMVLAEGSPASLAPDFAIFSFVLQARRDGGMHKCANLLTILKSLHFTFGKMHAIRSRQKHKLGV
jgi:hypothetical protein